MAKRTSGAAREAARRAAQPAKPPTRPSQIHPDVWAVMRAENVTVDQARDLLLARAAAQPAPPVAGASGTSRRDRRPPADVALERLRSAVRGVSIERQRLAQQEQLRDQLARRLHELGAPWEVVAREVGMSRQALVKRLGA